MGYVDVAGVSHTLPDGRVLFADVSFRVGEGARVALVGPNGAGKTTLLRMVAGDLPVKTGAIARSGGLGVMRQFIGKVRDESTVRDLLVSVAPERIRKAAQELSNGHNGRVEVLTIDAVVSWWARASDAERAALVRRVGVIPAWRAIEANLD